MFVLKLIGKICGFFFSLAVLIFAGFSIYFFIDNREMVTPVFQEYFGSSQEQVEEIPNEDENQNDEAIVVEDGENEIVLTKVS